MISRFKTPISPDPLFICSGRKLHSWADPEGGQGVLTPLKNHKNIGFLSNTGSDPLKNHKATKPTFNVGQSSAPVSETPFKWRFAGGPMMAHL